MGKIWNFSAGPAVLPEPVLQQVQKDMLSYKESGMSVMELSHRSVLFQHIMDDAELLLRELMDIPESYRILFLQGGASTQFAMVPMNLLSEKGKAGYVVSGSWGNKAYEEANKLYGDQIQVLADSSENKHTSIPDFKCSPEEFDYVHITTNNTIEGTAYHKIPQLNGIPLVADMSSNILSANYDIRDFDLVYAGAQKNVGPAGLTIVIIKEERLKNEQTSPTMLDYRTHIKNGSMYNTPPTFAIYVAKLTFEWLKKLGGVKKMVEMNQAKAHLLYDTIDQSKLFSSPIEKEFRSLTNIPFVSGDKELDTTFIKASQEKGFMNLKGHRSVGGMRVSLYNAFPLEGVQEFVSFMKEFEKQNKRM